MRSTTWPARVAGPDDQRIPVQTTKTAVHGSINTLGLAKRTKARILLTSTSEVYGDPRGPPATRGLLGHVNPIGPACYDEGKRAAETLFFDYWRQHDLSIMRSSVCSIPTVRECILEMVGWCQTS